MIVVKREATDEEEDGEEVGNSSVELQQQPLKRIRNREDEATDAMKSSKMKTTGLSFHDEASASVRLRMKETESSSKGSINVTDPSAHSPPVVKTESRQHSPATSVSSSEHNGIRSWSNQSSPNGHTTNNNNSKPIRPEIIFSHRRASTTVVSGVSMDTSPNGGSRTSPTLPPGSSPDQHHHHQNGGSINKLQSTTGTHPRVPSVILGQSGGVKTMVWTGHWADQQQPTPSRPRSVPSNGSEVQQPPPLVMAVHQNRPGSVKQMNNVQDAASIRLSIDGLLSLAQSSSDRRHGVVSRSSPPQVKQNSFQFLK
jgi:hypothetical protein